MGINKVEVLRYLGYKGQDLNREMDKLIDQSIDEINEKMKIRSIYRFFQLEKGTGKIQVRGTNIELLGKDISRHLKESKDCIIVAATLGHEVDRLIRYYERINMTKALILDTSASVAIEEAINKLNGDLKKEVSMDRKALTSR